MVCSFFPHRGYSLNCSSSLNSRGFIRSLMILLGSAAGSVSSSSISTSHRKSKWSLIILFISLTRWYSLDKAILYHLMVGEMIPEWHVAILFFISWGLGLSVLSLPLSISSTLHVWMRQNDTQHSKLHRCKRLHRCNEVASMQPLNHRTFGLMSVWYCIVIGEVQTLDLLETAMPVPKSTLWTAPEPLQVSFYPSTRPWWWRRRNRCPPRRQQ